MQEASMRRLFVCSLVLGAAAAVAQVPGRTDPATGTTGADTETPAGQGATTEGTLGAGGGAIVQPGSTPALRGARPNAADTPSGTRAGPGGMGGSGTMGGPGSPAAPGGMAPHRGMETPVPGSLGTCPPGVASSGCPPAGGVVR
jgi:hypothetical protein